MPELVESNEITTEPSAVKFPLSCLQLSRSSADLDLQSPRASSNAYCPQARQQIIKVLEEQWIQTTFPILHGVAQFHDDDIYCLWRACEGLLDVLTFSLRRISARNATFSSIESLGAAIVHSRVVSRRVPSLSVVPPSSTRSPSCLSPIDSNGSANLRAESSSEHASPSHRKTKSIDNRLPSVRAGSLSLAPLRGANMYDATVTSPSSATLPPVVLPASPILTRKRAATTPSEERSIGSSKSSVNGSPSHQRDAYLYTHKREYQRSLISIPSMGDEEKQSNDHPTPEDRIVAFLVSPEGSVLLRSDENRSTSSPSLISTISVQSIQPYITKHTHLSSGALFLALRSMSRSQSYTCLESLFDVVCRHANRTFILDMLRCSNVFDQCHKRIELSKRELDALATLDVAHLRATVSLMDAGNVKLGNSSPVQELIDIVTRSN